MKRLLNHHLVLIQPGTTDTTMTLAINARTDTDTDTTTVRKGIEAGSMTLTGEGTVIVMIDMEVKGKAGRPGKSGSPDSDKI